MTDNIPFKQFSIVDDPRQTGKIAHPLSKIFVITLTATLAGADNWTAIVEFAKPRTDWLSRFVDMSTKRPLMIKSQENLLYTGLMRGAAKQILY